MLTIIISIIALFLTLYQAHLQRVHNAKSVKPLGQIDLSDRKNHMFIYIQNNGLGPLIIDKLVFSKDGQQYSNISECLELDPKSYWHIIISPTVNKVVLPNSHLVVFEKNTEKLTIEDVDFIRRQLFPISLTVHCRDIYDNKFSFERNLQWFSRHTIAQIHECSKP